MRSGFIVWECVAVRRAMVQQTFGLIAVLAAGCGLASCDRGRAPDKGGAAPPAGADFVQVPEHKPQYAFAGDLATRRPQAAGFLRHFLETCLAGDYGGYRRLVTRAQEPESRARFEKILNALRAVTILSIEEVELPQVPPPAYLVIAEADFLPGQQAALRRHGGARKVAILVLEEEGEWRMAVAPADFQPADEEASSTSSSAPAEATPDYPWDRDSDY